jgi:PAS domain S-box-containing protein
LDCVRLLDYTGLSLDEALGWGWNAAVHPDDLDPLMDRWRALQPSGRAGEIEARLRRYDGEYRWFLFRAEPVRDNHGDIFKWHGANTDIEDRKRAEALLAAEKRTLKMIAGGARLADILENLCDTIDAQAGKHHFGGNADGYGRRAPLARSRSSTSQGWIEAISPLPISPCIGSCGTAASLRKRVIVSDIATDPYGLTIETLL